MPRVHVWPRPQPSLQSKIIYLGGLFSSITPIRVIVKAGSGQLSSDKAKHCFSPPSFRHLPLALSFPLMSCLFTVARAPVKSAC